MTITPKVNHYFSLFTDQDIHLFRYGLHHSLYEKLGAHLAEYEGIKGVYFAVWAPNAESIHVIGNFNGWNKSSHPLAVRWDSSGIWEGFVPGIGQGEVYKYSIISKNNHLHLEKGDPFAFCWEVPPRTASVVWDISYQWNDTEWLRNRAKKNALDAPMSVYELHFGSWQHNVEKNRPLTYREMAKILPQYLKELGFTHVEFMPLMEHPFYGSWGYQKVGYFAPSSRYGTPQDFKYLIDCLHQAGIGVFLDWVPSHFPSDGHGLAYFDGTHLFEHEDKRKGFHPEWTSYIFNYGRYEVKAFLISSALFWFREFHVDGLRVDGVSSMIYLDYARNNGDWVPNIYGGKENLEAIDFLKRLNETVYDNIPGVQMIAEESTAWPMVSRPTYLGGLGFGLKWNMGWMHDTLLYFSKDPIHRKFHQNDLTFSMVYVYDENFILSLSHDEVVYGKGALLAKMPGDDWQKFANLRLLYGYMYAHPGKKLLFMGSEIAQWNEWHHDSSLDWHLLQYDNHQGVKRLLMDLNHLYRSEPSLYQKDFDPSGFEWIDLHDADNSILCFARKSSNEKDHIVVVCNFTPVPRFNYAVGVSSEGKWKEIFNSDASHYGGSGMGNGEVQTDSMGMHGRPYRLTVTLPPLAIIMFKQ